MNYQGKLLRHELKYYINTSGYYIVKTKLQNILARDTNGKTPEGYHIRSLYFDDIFNSAMNDKVAGVSRRKKYRIRIYNNSDKFIRLECKYKYGDFISKASESLSRDQYDSILSGNLSFLLKSGKPLFAELYCQIKTRLLKPVVIVDYVREAYILNEGNIRITFDKELSAGIHGLDIFSPEVLTKKVLPAGIMIMEVKYDDYLPSYVQGLIQIPSCHRCAISKYVLCREQFVRVKHHD